MYSTDHIGELPLLLHPDSHNPGGPQHIRNPLHVTHSRVAQMSQDQQLCLNVQNWNNKKSFLLKITVKKYLIQILTLLQKNYYIYMYMVK